MIVWPSTPPDPERIRQRIWGPKSPPQDKVISSQNPPHSLVEAMIGWTRDYIICDICSYNFLYFSRTYLEFKPLVLGTIKVYAANIDRFNVPFLSLSRWLPRSKKWQQQGSPQIPAAAGGLLCALSASISNWCIFVPLVPHRFWWWSPNKPEFFKSVILPWSKVLTVLPKWWDSG